MTESTKDEENGLTAKAVGLFILVIILWLLSWFLLAYFIPSSAERGIFGDMFGAINALFSGLAFVGVIYAILLQKQELKYQREELKLTRAELRDQKAEMKAQNETLRRQRFENTFFQMVSLHNEIMGAIIVDDLVGRNAISKIVEVLRSEWQEIKASGTEVSMDDLKRVYEDIYHSHSNVLGHYFRNLYQIFKFVDESDIEEKKFYTNIIRAQLSGRELHMLLYNCSVFDEGNKFKKYVEKYSLLNNIDPTNLLEQSHIGMYEKEAYGDNVFIARLKI